MLIYIYCYIYLIYYIYFKIIVYFPLLKSINQNFGITKNNRRISVKKLIYLTIKHINLLYQFKL